MAIEELYHVEYKYAYPVDAPCSGAEWKEERDWPGVDVTLRLKKNKSFGGMAGELLAESVQVFGQCLTTQWGATMSGTPWRTVSKTFRRKTLALSEAAAKAYAVEQLRILDEQVIGPRRRRLAQRAETIAFSNSQCGTIKPPEVRCGN